MNESASQRLRAAYRERVPLAVRRPLYALRHPSRIVEATRRAAAHAVDPNVRAAAARLEALRDSQKGRRCVVMGNGPSLNKMDLDVFEGEDVWGSNRCYLLFDRVKWRPRHFVSVDTRVVPDIADEILSLADELTGTSFYFPVHFREQWTLRSRPNIYWFNEVPIAMDRLPEGAFTRDAPRRVHRARTVTVAALQLAVHLGYHPIYLIGCDTSYTIPATARAEGGDSERLVSTQDDDPNHFDPRYFGKGRKWHDPHVENMIFHYEQTKQVCDALGVEIVNATVGGNLEVFPRVDYRDVFGR